MIRSLAAAVSLLTVLAAPAQATEWITCGDSERKVSFDILVGFMEVIAIDTIRIETGGKIWSTKGEAGTISITRGQSFETPDQIWIDVMDENVNAFVARFRVFKASDDTEGVEERHATGGVLHMPGIGVWTVGCSGP